MSNENRANMKTLELNVDLVVRFSETDAMGVVWHGNYLKFFEDAREEFGNSFGLEYLTMHANGFFTPIVKSNINHKASVYYGQKMNVKIVLQYTIAAKIVFTYEIVNLNTNEIAATGSTTQVFLSVEDRVLELNKPDFYVEWESKQNWIVND